MRVETDGGDHYLDAGDVAEAIHRLYQGAYSAMMFEGLTSGIDRFVLAFAVIDEIAPDIADSLGADELRLDCFYWVHDTIQFGHLRDWRHWRDGDELRDRILNCVPQAVCRSVVRRFNRYIWRVRDRVLGELGHVPPKDSPPTVGLDALTKSNLPANWQAALKDYRSQSWPQS